MARTRLDHGHGVAAGQSTASISSETVILVTRYVEEWARTPGKVVILEFHDGRLSCQ